jgi:predicted TIM-barrel fold metal-dependent hydrolase
LAEYQVISADSHVVEPGDLWERHMEPAWREKAPRLVHASTMDLFVWEGGKTAGYGRMAGAGRRKDALEPLGRFADYVPDGAWQPQARLRDMATDGVDAEVLYPTTALWMFRGTAGEYQRACFRAYNRWLGEFCAYQPERLKGIALISLDDLASAVEDLQEARGLGLVGAMIAVYPGDERQYDQPTYDPFWSAAQGLTMPLSLHVATERQAGLMLPQSRAGTMVVPIPVQLSIGAMVVGGVFDRFPSLHVVSVENDAGWAACFALRMDFRFKNDSHLIGYACKELPSAYMRRNVHVAFVDDLSVIPTRHLLGAENILWSSDYPHYDSNWPESRRVIEEHFEGVPEAERRLMVCDNARRIYGF